MLRPKDRILRLLFVFVPVTITILANDLINKPTLVKFGGLAVTIFSAIVVSEFCRILVYCSRGWFKKYRYLLTFLSGIGFITIILTIDYYARSFITNGYIDAHLSIDSDVYINDKRISIGILGNSFSKSLLIFPVLFACYEIVYQSATAKMVAVKNEFLEKEKLKAELQQLKGIVNPHFLFNNLNSLSSLISENPQQAQDFLDELTKVFRYLIRNNQTELTTLSQELQFIQSYFNLLETRYGKGITLSTRINPDDLALFLPPLTLQLLVENAAKHNAINKDNPLQIEIESAGDQKLVIKNNIVPRKGNVESTGIGLQNICSRYMILNQQPPVITKDREHFTVVIALIPKIEVEYKE